MKKQGNPLLLSIEMHDYMKNLQITFQSCTLPHTAG